MYELKASPHDERLFYAMDAEAAERCGWIGHLRMDFGSEGREFWPTWFDRQPHLKTPAVKAELDAVINSLRNDGEKPPFASRKNLTSTCYVNPGQKLGISGDSNGYLVQTLDFSYYFRCKPARGEYDIYCFTFDNRYLLPELAGQHELPNFCYSILTHNLLPRDDELIKIKLGESGYFKIDYNDGAELLRKTVDTWNQTIGVTRAQEEAMLAGSMFGWDTPAACPWKYDQDGKPRPPQPKKDAPER